MFTTKTSSPFMQVLRKARFSGRTLSTSTFSLPRNVVRRGIHATATSDAPDSGLDEISVVPQSNQTYHSTLLRVVISNVSGSLASTLDIFHKHRVRLTRTVSNQSQVFRSQKKSVFEMRVNGSLQDENVKSLIAELRQRTEFVIVISSWAIPWFPTKESDLDAVADDCLYSGVTLDADHPGFTDEVYKKRRSEIAGIAQRFKGGERIPSVEYTAEEVETWGYMFDTLTQLYPNRACMSYMRNLTNLVANCGFSSNSVPQLHVVSDYLKSETGFIIRPVSGLLSSRNFLAGLALRIFHSTQYLRHHSRPEYTPEPDLVHELMGHVPMFLNQDFADFSQQIGLLSLGASDDLIKKLATIYWFTVEFGLVRELGERSTVELKLNGEKYDWAFGAGLLSSIGELQYCLSDEPKVLNFDPHIAAVTEYPITQMQPKYFLAQNFEVMKQQMLYFSSEHRKNFDVTYNSHSRALDIFF